MNRRDGPGDYALLPDRRRRKITRYVDVNRSKQLPQRSHVITRSVFGRDFIPPRTPPTPPTTPSEIPFYVFASARPTTLRHRLMSVLRRHIHDYMVR